MSTFDFEHAANVMFGSTTGSAQQTRSVPESTTSADQMAERLFPRPEPYQNQREDENAGKPIADLSEGDQAQRLYGGTDPTLTHADATLAIVSAGMEDHLHDPETAHEIAAEWAATFADHQLNATESKQLADLGASVLRSPPSDETMATWVDTAVDNLKAEYGVQGAGQALQDARAYVAAHPGLADQIDALGLGNHPKLVAIAAAKGRALRLAGKLRV